MRLTFWKWLKIHAHVCDTLQRVLSKWLSSVLQTQSKQTIILLLFVVLSYYYTTIGWPGVCVCMCVWCGCACSSSFFILWKVCWICAGIDIKILSGYALLLLYCSATSVVAVARSELVAYRPHFILHGPEMCPYKWTLKSSLEEAQRDPHTYNDASTRQFTTFFCVVSSKMKCSCFFFCLAEGEREREKNWTHIRYEHELAINIKSNSRRACVHRRRVIHSSIFIFYLFSFCFTWIPFYFFFFSLLHRSAFSHSNVKK